ncbi:MAG: glycosyltransferase family 25 protein [Elusimicrobiota bacterium]|nr:glycosyltransferase family 25 protein [Elusimicrobiota bacterium]
MKLKGYIVHVKTDYAREKHIKEQIKNLNIDFTFVNDGDQTDLTMEIISKNFIDGLNRICGETSCTYKHFLAYRDMIDNNIDYGIIFENDIFLDKNFEKSLFKAIDEIENADISGAMGAEDSPKSENIFLSLEDSYFKFVRGSERKKGQTVYKIDRNIYGRHYLSRCAGAYLVNLNCVKAMIKKLDTNKTGEIIDCFITTCAREKLIDIYWLHPTIATQGSRNGMISSMFSERKVKYPLFLRRFYMFTQRYYKKALWSLR